jgi:MerR family redox-sensitive transcriptional activator SoxR
LVEVSGYCHVVSKLPDLLTIGQVAERSGIPHTALRFYEERGLITSIRTTGNQRRYERPVLRRLSFIRAAQRVGLSLEDIRSAFATLPAGHAPSKSDWERLSRNWRAELDARIDALQRLRDRLSGCIGCGCLSLRSCLLQNSDDRMAALGPGAPRLKPASEGGA